MTVEEKLNYFEQSCMEDAKKRANKILEDHKKALEQSFEEHKKNEQRRFDIQLKIESEQIQREGNKHLSIEQIKLRSKAGIEKTKLKEDLLVCLKEKLQDFRQTDAYLEMLKHQIDDAIAFAKDDILKIYIDSEDIRQFQALKQIYGNLIYQSQYPFFGGSRAVIEERNILIDNSFEKRIEEEFETFQFGGTYE